MTIPERLANRDIDPSAVVRASDLPERARVVIVGGGIIGSSIAYHLTREGETDVVVLERGRLTNGTTWHAAGLVSQVRGTHALTALSRTNADTYERLPGETGVETGLRRVGALTVARTEPRMQEILYGVSMARDAGIDVEVIEAAAVKDHWPAAVVDDLVGAVLFPTDGTVNPGDAALAFAKGATDRGASFVPDTEVTGFRVDAASARVLGLDTSRGAIEAETVVLAAGLWTSELARLAGASVSLYPAEHVWVMTEEAQGAREEAPFLRDLDAYLYIRHYRGRYLIGAFEADGKPRRPAGIPTDGFVEFGPDWDHFAPVLTGARQRVPEVETIGFSHYLRAPESFTPDSNFQLGFVPEVPGLFVAAGFNSQGIIFGPGAGLAAAQWIVAGHPTMDLAEVDVARMGRWANQRAWLHERTVESLGAPVRDALAREAAPRRARGSPGAAVRGVPRRRSCVRPGRRVGARELVRAGRGRSGRRALVRCAVVVPGRARGGAGDTRGRGRCTTCRPTRSSWCRAEGALDGLQRLATSDLDVPVGRIVYTLLCNERGGIEMDPTVTRLGEDRFLVLAPTLAQRRTEALLRSGLPTSAIVTDVTSGWATLHLAGPSSRELLARLTDEDLSNDAWPFLEACEIDVARARAWAFRVSFTGELGWELSVPTEFVADLYERVVDAGASLGLRHAGAFAFDAARIERGFRSWGHDVGPLDDPFAAGVGFAVSRAKPVDFVGREALEALRETPRERRLVSVHASDAVLWHGESVVHGDERLGHVSSASIAPTLGGSAALAWIHGEPAEGGWGVEIRGQVVPAVVQADPFYDPRGERLRS